MASFWTWCFFCVAFSVSLSNQQDVIIPENCKEPLEKFFECTSDAHESKKITKSQFKAKIQECFQPCDELPIRPSSERFQCLKQIKTTIQSKCQDTLDLGINLPENVGGRGFMKFLRSPTETVQADETGSGWFSTIASWVGSAIAGWWSSSDASTTSGGGGLVGGGGYDPYDCDDDGDGGLFPELLTSGRKKRDAVQHSQSKRITKLMSLATRICPKDEEQAVVDCLANVDTQMKNEFQEISEKFSVCHSTLEKEGCKDSLANLKSEMCSCAENVVTDEGIISGITDCFGSDSGFMTFIRRPYFLRSVVRQICLRF